MPRLINKCDLSEISHEESKNELIISTNSKTDIHILEAKDRTIIRFTKGNKFDIVDGMIIIHKK